MSNARSKSKIMEFALIFAIVYLLTQVGMRFFFPDQYEKGTKEESIILSTTDSTVKGGHHPILTLKNRTETDLILEDRCPMPPVDVWFIAEGGEKTLLETEETTLPCVSLTEIKAGESATIDLGPWKYSLFAETGQYEVQLIIEAEESEEAKEAKDSQGESPNVLSATFGIYEVGTLTQLFRTFITKPFLNFLIFTASILPDHNLGWAVIILTVLVKLLLFFPTQHAMEGQQKLQAIQPEIDVLRKKYKDDAKKLQEETMKLWKKHGANPMQSCLPMLIQFPILIGLFFVIRDGSTLELSHHLIYSFYQNLPWTFGTNFYGLDLLQPSVYLMPPLLVVMQFMQMKLSFAIADKKKEKNAEPSLAKASEGKTQKKKTIEQQSTQQMQQKMMLYGLPLMIGFFAIRFPAAVSLYWAISTLFGIGQQLVVNRKSLR